MDPGDELPAECITVRLAKKSDTLVDPPAPAFFLRRQKGERDLSLGWPGYFEDLSPTEQLAECLRAMALNFTPKKKDRVLIVDVDQARSLLASIEELNQVKFIYTPVKDQPNEPDNPCHASVEGLFPLAEAFEQSAAQQLALAVTENHEWEKIQPKAEDA